MKKRVFAILLALVVLFAFAGCTTTQPQTSPTASSDDGTMAIEDLVIGFIYIGPVGDGGWTDAHDAGRQAAIAAYPGLQTMITENVPETADCEQAIRNLIDQGCNVIFATSFGFQDYTVNMAAEYPDVKFFHATGYMTSDNLSQYNGRMYQPRFLAGIAAGMKSESGKIGYVAAFPIPEVLRGINAYALGAKLANPDATVEVLWTNSWVDPAAARLSAEELLNRGCDVLGYHQDFTTPIVAAQEKGCFATGNNVSSVGVADDAYLTAPLFNWGAYYVEIIGQIMDGTYVGGESYWGSMADGMVSLDALTDNCAEGTQAMIDEYTQKIMDGTWDVFTGEIKDQAGTVKVAEGETMSDEDLSSMDWFADNVIGTIQ